MKKVLIFGKGGQLGHDLASVFNGDYTVLAYDRSEADITNADQIQKIISQEKPWLVINATAYNKVEAAETSPKEAFGINATGVENLAKGSEAVGAIFVHVSTDYVFDGSKEFFTEEDVTHPLNVYGKSKLEGESLAKAVSSKCYILRTSAVFGAKQGNQKINFVDRMIMMAKEGQTLKVVDDQVTSPTYSLDLARKIKELVEKPAPFGLYHVTNSGSCSWYGFAKKILELMNLKTDILAITTEQSGTKVSRPRTSVLKNEALQKINLPPMLPWEDALKRYLTEKYQI